MFDRDGAFEIKQVHWLHVVVQLPKLYQVIETDPSVNQRISKLA
jgi:hypothetical protein